MAVCARGSAAPVNVTVAVPATAPAAAVRVTPWEAPGINFSVAGEAVTPVGKPLTVTATVPAKPWIGVASSAICDPEPPAITVSLVGVTAKEKSGGGLVSNSCTVAVRTSAPDVPVNVSVEPNDADPDADTVTICAVPGVSVRVVGVAVTPVGSPEIATVTGALNPFTAFAVTLTCPLPPTLTARLAGVAARPKSPVVPPHPARPTAAASATASPNRLPITSDIDTPGTRPTCTLMP